MTETKITFHNQAKIKVQAQIFTGYTLVGSCVIGPGESYILPAGAVRYDIFLKHGTTGWEIARQMDSAAKTITLRQYNKRYVLSGE